MEAYAFLDENEIGTARALDDKQGIYPYDGETVMYSGLGEGYVYDTESIILKASELIGSHSKGKSFPTHYRIDCGATFSIRDVSSNTSKNQQSDLIPMQIAGEDYDASPFNIKPLHNVGNWGFNTFTI